MIPLNTSGSIPSTVLTCKRVHYYSFSDNTVLIKMEEDMLKNIANVLSTLTIMSCLFLKLPQIFQIREKQSAEGIFIQALLMEVFGFSIMILYNFINNYSIMTYLEYPIILIQVYVMFYYVLKFKDLMHLPIVPIAAIAYTFTVIGFIMGVIPKVVLSYLVPVCTPLSSFAKVTYIYGIVRDENADAISLTTWVISVATNLSRLFTIYVDSGDKKLMINFSISSILSSAVLGTALYYKNLHPTEAPPLRCRKQFSGRSQSRGRRYSHSD